MIPVGLGTELSKLLPTGFDHAVVAPQDCDKLFAIARRLFTAHRMSTVDLAAELAPVSYDSLTQFAELSHTIKEVSVNTKLLFALSKRRRKISPIGRIHLERIEMYPAGVQKGELSRLFAIPRSSFACADDQLRPQALLAPPHLRISPPLDGVYVRDSESGALVFEELSPPSQAEVLDIARRTAERVDRLLRMSGRSLERDEDEPVPELLSDEPGLAACYAAAAQGISVSGEPSGKAPAQARLWHCRRPRESGALHSSKVAPSAGSADSACSCAMDPATGTRSPTTFAWVAARTSETRSAKASSAPTSMR